MGKKNVNHNRLTITVKMKYMDGEQYLALPVIDKSLLSPLSLKLSQDYIRGEGLSQEKFFTFKI